jgi:GAF domain-containing protein
MNSEERAASAEAAEAERDDGLERRIHSDDTGLPSPSEQDADVVGSLNYVAGSFAVGSIIDHLAVAPALERSQFRVFLYDESADRLLPVFQPDTSIDSQGWAIGTGATGTAYESGEYVVAEGASVTDATHSLTPEQQERYRHLTAVASAPIFNAAGRVIGVLTVSSTRPDHELGSADAEQAITLGALLLSRVLIDLLGWFDDTD